MGKPVLLSVQFTAGNTATHSPKSKILIDRVVDCIRNGIENDFCDPHKQHFITCDYNYNPVALTTFLPH